MTFSIFQPGLASGSKTVRRPPVGEPVNIEAVQQQVPHAGYSLIGTGPGSPNWEERHGKDHNYNDPESGFQALARILAADPRPESAIQAVAAALDATFLTEAVSRQWLAETEKQLDDCSSCAAEEELPPPSTIAIARTRELLQQFSTSITSQPDIYPMDESNIAIDFRTPDGGSSVLFVVDQDGSGVMFYRTEGVRGRIRVDDASQLIGEGAIAKLRRVGIR